ncbi:oxidoreductase [Rhizobium sp. BK251]|uniref:oxidoreductase n=1 Tax=Rhizobium sp. BK251 TaxID=2512125 RepID=UPI0010493082|nr:oxidoreductase [Rhizobium sp. BK251]TCL68278.1 short-subunit dehydrogenase [Rhizobium sp. BK251]
MSAKNFLITGVSQGLGRAFAEAALGAGHRVAGTVRSQKAVADFEAVASSRAKAIVLDVTDFDAVKPAVQALETEFGPIDVLVNNAGYGHEGILEESSLDEIRRQFDVNVFGAVAVIKAVLPGMRARRRGHIVNVTSMAGIVGLPGIAYYAGSKFALEGISEVLANEVHDFGIHVTALAPGSFRTEWAGKSMIRSDRSIADYDRLFTPIREGREQKSGRQVGDPAEAARVLIDLVEEKNPPVHLILGADALKLVRDRTATFLGELDTWEEVSLSTDFA